MTFEDVPRGHWAHGYVERAVSAAVIVPSDYGTRLAPDAPVTRLEAAVAAVRARRLDGDAVRRRGENLPYTETASLPDWAKGYLAVALREGLMMGMGDGTFAASSRLTRAEAVVVAGRLARLGGPDVYLGTRRREVRLGTVSWSWLSHGRLRPRYSCACELASGCWRSVSRLPRKEPRLGGVRRPAARSAGLMRRDYRGRIRGERGRRLCRAPNVAEVAGERSGRFPLTGGDRARRGPGGAGAWSVCSATRWPCLGRGLSVREKARVNSRDQGRDGYGECRRKAADRMKGYPLRRRVRRDACLIAWPRGR